MEQYKHYDRVLAVAGSDSGGGAGIQADIKAISATGSYASSAVTAVTVQNTLGVSEVCPIPPYIVSAQIKAVLSDIGADAVKTGMLHSSATIEAVADVLSEFRVRNIVADPVMVSTSGHRLMEEDAVSVMKSRLFPLARIITPNIPEAEILSGSRIDSVADMNRVARSLAVPERMSVLLKGGHMEGDTVCDVLFDAENDRLVEFRAEKVQTINTHGTGCTLSSALASFLAHRYTLVEAVRLSREYLREAILSGSRYRIGSGHGPVNHFWKTENQRF